MVDDSQWWLIVTSACGAGDRGTKVKSGDTSCVFPSSPSHVAEPKALLYKRQAAQQFQNKNQPQFYNKIFSRAPQLFGRLSRPKLSTHKPNSNNRVKCPISKVSKGPNRVRDKPEDRTYHSESSVRYRFRWAGGLVHVQKGVKPLCKPKPTPNPLPIGYDPNAICHYHQSRGHWPDNCWNEACHTGFYWYTKQFVLPPAPATTAQPNILHNPCTGLKVAPAHFTLYNMIPPSPWEIGQPSSYWDAPLPLYP